MDGAPTKIHYAALPHHHERWAEVKAILSATISNPEELTKAISKISQGPCGPFWTGVFQDEDSDEYQQVFGALPLVQQLALRVAELFPEPVPLLVEGAEQTLVLNREQCASLIACSFFGMFPLMEQTALDLKYPKFAISDLYGCSPEFVFCLLNYFKRVLTSMPEGKIRFHRKFRSQFAYPDYAKSTKKICQVEISDKMIENISSSPFHADFANKSIGGGVLHGGMVQEEILFVIKPECLVSMLFCSIMKEGEAIIITGAEQFSTYSGYGRSFKFAGDFEDKTPKDKRSDCIKNYIVAVDAVNISSNPSYQFTPKAMEREITKDADKRLCDVLEQYSLGFHHRSGSELGEESSDQVSVPVYVTGHWGCGAFGGDKQLKTLQQIISASEAGASLLYCSFGDKKWEEAFRVFLGAHEHVTVGQLYTALLNVRSDQFSNIFKAVSEALNLATQAVYVTGKSHFKSDRLTIDTKIDQKAYPGFEWNYQLTPLGKSASIFVEQGLENGKFIVGTAKFESEFVVHWQIRGKLGAKL